VCVLVCGVLVCLDWSYVFIIRLGMCIRNPISSTDAGRDESFVRVSMWFFDVSVCGLLVCLDLVCVIDLS